MQVVVPLPSTVGALKRLTVLDIFPVRDIVWVTENCSLETTLEILSDKNILSVPVLNNDKSLVIGSLDVLDIATFIVSKFPEPTRITEETITQLQIEGTNIARNTPIGHVIASKFNAGFAPVKLGETLERLVDILSRGFRRVPIINNENRVINFVSQTDVVRYFAERIHLLGDKGNQTLTEFGIDKTRIAYVRFDISVIQALSFMVTQGISAVAVVGENGKLVANLSASDLRGIKAGDFPLLLQSVSTFLLNYHPMSLHPLTCLPTNNLEYVILKLVAAKVHRLWCVNPSFDLIGVVSITDVMKFFLGIAPMT